MRTQNGRRRLRQRITLGLATLLIAITVWPQSARIPVAGAGPQDWNPSSFWTHPWGQSGVHKGIDIFARANTPVLAATSGLVIYQGTFGIGGNVIAILGPHWRIHYYAHLSESHAGGWASRGESIGSVGTTGNAAGKPPHLHYAVLSLLPAPWRISQQPQGWKQMFFIDPGTILAPK